MQSGSARVLSTAKGGVLCNAYVLSAGNDPSNVMMQILITAPKKQKGQ